MIRTTPWIGRRTVIAGLTAAGTSLLFSGTRAVSQITRIATPPQTEGPFYPTEWRDDTDNDLVMVRGAASEALGQVVHIEGRVMRVTGAPVGNAAVEIWQCDNRGIYRHPQDEGGRRRRDDGFQGRGRTLTDAEGRYRFRTIRPVPYGSRTPHIHFKVVPPAGQLLITQMYVFGEPLNARDGVLGRMRDISARDSLIVRLEAADRLELGALVGTFDIVLA
jgi:protocatechuate 3,4-dioxygenase beta subunit